LGRRKLVEEKPKERTSFHRAIDPEVREKQLIALSYNLAEERLLNGTASAQEVCHFLKLGSMEKQLELEKLKNENALLAKKVEVLDAQKDTEQRYIEAIEAMKTYSGRGED
jgi:hypothetical protein